MSEIEVSWSMRQNFGKCMTNIFEMVEKLQVIMCPGYHTKDAVFSIIDNSENGFTPDISERSGQRKHFFNNVMIGHYAIVFEERNKEKALLIQITGNPYIRYIPEITIYKNTSRPGLYNDSICAYRLTGKEYNKKYDITEKVWGIVRNVTIIRYISSDEPIFRKYWNFQGSIIRNRSDKRYIPLYFTNEDDVYTIEPNIDPFSEENNELTETTSKKHTWTEIDNMIISLCYIHKYNIEEICKMLPDIPKNSIRMKLSNCLFLDKGTIPGSLQNVSRTHNTIWNLITHFYTESNNNTPSLEEEKYSDNMLLENTQIEGYIHNIDIKTLCEKSSFIQLTTENAIMYIGYNILFTSKNVLFCRKILDISNSSIKIDFPDLHNTLQIISRNIFVLVKKDTIQQNIIRIPNIDTYTQEIIQNELVITPKKDYITENELYMLDMKHSRIIQCIVTDRLHEVSTQRKYASILIDIWRTMPSQKILQTTTCNVKLTNENGRNGYTWYEPIHMSFQRKDAKGTLQEIIHMVRVNHYTIHISIRLSTGREIHFIIE